jgi:AP-1 complex subunit gamma-1
LIKSIRATKTIADERVLITKESAAIRSAFKEERGEARWGRVCVCRGI